jgi:leucyl aminopeptidase
MFINQTLTVPSEGELADCSLLALLLPATMRRANRWSDVPYGALLRERLERYGERTPLVTDLPNLNGTRVVLDFVPEGEPAFAGLTRSRRLAARLLAGSPERLTVIAPGLPAESARPAIERLVAALLAADHPMPRFKREQSSPTRLAQVDILGLERPMDFDRTEAEAQGNNLARTLTALPANRLTPAAYRERVQALAEENGWAYHFHDLAALEAEGAGAFLAVARGSEKDDAGIVHLRYMPEGGGEAPRVSLVGKGICYDTGGNNLKAARHMHGMHQDMGGSAVALGTFLALSQLGVDYPVDCWLALAENHIGPKAYKPNDVVSAVGGSTIEVIHTDAEGRMVLADTLALASRRNPELIIDYATLTGSCKDALGEAYSGVLTNRDAFIPELIEAGRASGERVWPFPMDADYDEELHSEVADIKQCTLGNEADHILAARFLSRFVGDAPWVHLDLSAARHRGGLAHVPTEATGFGVRFTLMFLSNKGLLAKG